MSYCTLALLSAAKLARELAEVATPERYRVIDEALMDATLLGGDRSAYSADDIAIADLAALHVQGALDEADGVINGYLRMRKPLPYTVPLATAPRIVTTWARWIARYLLHKDRVNTQESTDPVVRDYKEALKFLALVRDGQFSLGAGDPLDPPSGGSPEICAPPREFTMGSLRDFGQ
ncbi:gp436 family protein [Xanthomonas citri]|uniref:gp436 family protein n=1 Tax=Xanthomonas citri TaxID=346 RepID=UPI0001CECD25|nr:DUF1320 domain-containing protein [Xanthomonas citri]AMV00328.1 bacteriophage protein [Xanthomonas citri pv. aurantifolii]AMV04644.1 bacteriophage protein [Xanthomonas citri pv. aurantifolii]EFF46471.1 hypothetical protein XAUC_31190 [Xanthomonas citri pv. aurantifolii str. ICPB 10535]MCC8491380.1 DUF1320 domain-containing protein [Xanthomonas citri pv. fuscans]TBW97644.1 bacteriophage protein [Xanthomonas citri pv. aurantifolii]